MSSGKAEAGSSALRLAAVGLEAEFSLMLNNEPASPEAVFGNPRAFIRGELVHRVGTSYQLPTGAAIYFDTGVIEVATPIIELERGCMSRAGRVLWESICFVRDELDAWQRRSDNTVRLVGFSAHYNVSIEAGSGHVSARRLDALARLLTYILPAPVMLLATNRQSTGVGVRPRRDRIEVTVDFTPNPTLMVATGSLIAGIVRSVAAWKSFEMAELKRRHLPRIRGFRPMPHTSRKGWLARVDCFPANPITADVGAAIWPLAGRPTSAPASLRDIATETFNYFGRSIARVADPLALRLIREVLTGRSTSLLDLDTRPPEYEDVGHLCSWPRFYSDVFLERSRFERVVLHALSGDKLHIDGDDYTPTGMQGWSRIVFRRDSDGYRVTLPLDDLVAHLPSWGRRRSE